MARCPNCGKHLSDKAVMCPECGHIVNKSSSQDDFAGCITMVIMTILFVAGISWLLYRPFKNRSEPSQGIAVLAIVIM